MTSTIVVKNFINGAFVDANDHTTIENVNPATSEVFATIPNSKCTDAEAAIAAAHAAFPAWSALPYTERAAWLSRIADGIEARLDELATLESRDNGKPVALATRVDIPRSVANFRFFASALLHDEVQATHMVDALNYSQRQPLGVCGLITPWNLPLYLLSWKIAPALAMGNTVVAKPSEMTPMTANALAEIVADIGLPPGVLNIVHGYGQYAGQAIVEHPHVRGISFTGGTVTGRRVAAIAAPMFKKLSLELGGKNATVVFADCDFDTTVEGVYRASFANQGQICLCGSRLFIEKSIYERFVNALVDRVGNTIIGDPRTSSFGSLISKQHRDKVASYVEQARADGANILTGGCIPKLDPPFDNGAFYAPTIITGLGYDHKCAQEEIFGPVITVHPFETEDEVMEQVNSVIYGLAGSVWTSNISRGHRVAQRFESGMVWVNCWLLRDLRVPFGGVKSSGVGREGGSLSLEAYSEWKNICIKL